jgi:hypothetical protein
VVTSQTDNYVSIALYTINMTMIGILG